MTKKARKRQLSEVESNENVKISKNNDQVGKDLPKKKKLKSNSDNSNNVTKQDVNVSNNAAGAENASKKSKKKKKKTKKHENSEDIATDKASSAKEDSEKSKNTTETGKKPGKVISSKRQDLFKQKRQEFREQRKAVRLEEGQFSSVNKLSVEEMKKKIAEIESRESITKTAIRKLRILKKKVNIEEGTADDIPSPSPKRKSDALEGNKKEHKNKKFKKDVPIKTEIKTQSPVGKGDHKVNETKKSNKEKHEQKKQKQAAKKITEQTLFIEDRVGDNPVNDSEDESDEYEEDESEISRSKKILKAILKKKNEKTVKVDTQNGDDEEESDSEVEEDDNVNAAKPIDDSVQDSDDDDSEDESNSDQHAPTKQQIIKSKKNVKTDINIEKASSDDDEDQEEEEGSDSEVVENEEKKSDESLSKEKVKKDKVPKELKKQKKNDSNENDSAGKKQRYVLFVGNLSYEATTVDIKKHFLTKVSMVKDVRIPLKPGSNTPRGFGYVEVDNSTDYEKGLSLHNTFINGRQINVEYTKSGSKNVTNRQEIVHKNKKLHAMRKAGMLAGSKQNFQKRSFRRKPDNRNSKNES